MSTSNSTEDQLPAGWVQQYDERTQHPFWVDTKAQPPRSIWVHPYKDEQFLKEHPEVREELRGLQEDLPPPYSPRRHSYSGTPTTNDEESSGRTTISQPSTPNTGTNGRKHRGFFGKLKDKAIGTKEEREAARKQEMLMQQQLAEQRRQQMASNPYGVGASSYGGIYGPPVGNPYAYNYGFGGRGIGGGFGGAGLPLAGGLLGGFLIGEALVNNNYGGGWGDGGFGDGNWGNGGFGGPF